MHNWEKNAIFSRIFKWTFQNRALELKLSRLNIKKNQNQKSKLNILCWNYSNHILVRINLVMIIINYKCELLKTLLRSPQGQLHDTQFLFTENGPWTLKNRNKFIKKSKMAARQEWQDKTWSTIKHKSSSKLSQ